MAATRAEAGPAGPAMKHDRPNSSGTIASDLHFALGRMVRRLRQAHSPGDLTLAESTLLSRLVRGAPATPGELAAEARIRPQAVCNTLAALEKRHLVTRTGDPSDGRRVLMSATGDGVVLLSERHNAKAALIANALDSSFTARERKVLAEAAPLLDRLAEVL
jgi:DNA-binding MarR family transcriptional regulator